MPFHLIRLRCERLYQGADGKAPELPAPNHRLFDVPPGMANQIAGADDHLVGNELRISGDSPTR